VTYDAKGEEDDSKTDSWIATTDSRSAQRGTMKTLRIEPRTSLDSLVKAYACQVAVRKLTEYHFLRSRH
jgi:hypothetical protein